MEEKKTCLEWAALLPFEYRGVTIDAIKQYNFDYPLSSIDNKYLKVEFLFYSFTWTDYGPYRSPLNVAKNIMFWRSLQSDIKEGKIIFTKTESEIILSTIKEEIWKGS